MIDNAEQRFGSAGFATKQDVARAGLFTQTPSALLVGFMGRKPLFYDGAGGLLLTAGARSGKLRDILAYNICSGICTGVVMLLDMKGELSAISQDQTPDKKFGIYWNPSALHKLPQHRINPVDYLRIDSPTLVADTKVFCENMVVLRGFGNSDYFQGRAQEYLEAVVLTLVGLNGELTLGDLYRAINTIPGGGEAWLDFAYDMQQSGFPVAVRVEEEIATSRNDPTGGFRGILGELFKAVSCLSDPQLLASVSPPFDFSLGELCDAEQVHQLSLMPPAEFVSAWSPVIKAMFVGAMIYKSRSPDSPRQTWILDECAQLGTFPAVVKLFTYGAGIGIRPWAIFQATDQMQALGPNAETIIPSSAQLRSYFGVRDIKTASEVSRMIGHQTLEFHDSHRTEAARHSKREALLALAAGNDPLKDAMSFARHNRDLRTAQKQSRELRTPDEILNTSVGKQYIFADGLPLPLYADRKAYYEQRFMAGRYHPNPYHPPPHRVRVRTWRGAAWRNVVSEPVPEEFDHYPQYVSGQWSRIE